jgi:hypothetical protein
MMKHLVTIIIVAVLWSAVACEQSNVKAPLSDDDFISVATQFVTLTANYEPQTARERFEKAKNYLIEPELTVFEMLLAQELPVIEKNLGSQKFQVARTILSGRQRESQGESAVVIIEGEQFKTFETKQLAGVPISYRVTLVTPEKSGIKICNLEVTADNGKTDNRNEK